MQQHKNAEKRMRVCGFVFELDDEAAQSLAL